MGPLPDGCTFTIAIESKDEIKGNLPTPSLPTWIPQEERSEESHAVFGDSIYSGTVSLLPIRHIAAGPLRMEIFIEEGKAKQKLKV